MYCLSIVYQTYEYVVMTFPPSLLPLQHVSMYVVFISHLSQRPFHWEQWVQLPWTLFHVSKDKRESWKEETRPLVSQSQQQQQRRTLESRSFPSSCRLHTGKARLAPGWRELRNSSWLYNTQTIACSVISEKSRNKPKQVWHVCFLFYSLGLSQGSRVKAESG